MRFPMHFQVKLFPSPFSIPRPSSANSIEFRARIGDDMKISPFVPFLQILNKIGITTVKWGNDYPHRFSIYTSTKTIIAQIAHCDIQRKKENNLFVIIDCESSRGLSSRRNGGAHWIETRAIRDGVA